MFCLFEVSPVSGALCHTIFLLHVLILLPDTVLPQKYVKAFSSPLEHPYATKEKERRRVEP